MIRLRLFFVAFALVLVTGCGGSIAQPGPVKPPEITIPVGAVGLPPIPLPGTNTPLLTWITKTSPNKFEMLTIGGRGTVTWGCGSNAHDYSAYIKTAFVEEGKPEPSHLNASGAGIKINGLCDGIATDFLDVTPTTSNVRAIRFWAWTQKGLTIDYAETLKRTWDLTADVELGWRVPSK